MSGIHIDTLEHRRLLSVSIAETEPNDAPGGATQIPHALHAPLHVTAALGAPGDSDWF